MTSPINAGQSPRRYHSSYRRCGKPNCATCSVGPGHGPYWYASWREGKRVRSRYLGKSPPSVTVPVEFKIFTLGRLAIQTTVASEPVLTGRSRELLTYLLSAPYGSAGREEIAEALWPEHDPLLADQSVRSTVATLRRKLGVPDAVRIVGPAVVLSLPSGCRDDLIFEAMAREALETGKVASLSAATSLYGGPYLPQDVYNDWTEHRRRALADLRRQLVMRVAEESHINTAARVEPLRSLLDEDPTDEVAAGRLVEELAATGRRAEAMRVLNRVEAALWADLGIEPDEPLRSLRRGLAG